MRWSQKLCALSVTLAGCLAANTAARADDGAMVTVGGNVELMNEHPQIEMVSEFVHAWIAENSARVECIFFLHNTGDSTTALIGFPDTGGGSDVNPEQPERYNSFSSFVDGHPVTVWFEPDTSEHGEEQYAAWYLKRVHFGRGQTRCVRDVYVGQLGSSVGDHGWFSYSLDTGGSWLGKIGTADLVFTFEGGWSEFTDGSNVKPWSAYQMDSNVKPTSRSGNEWRWHLANFKPTRDWLSEVTVSWDPKVNPLTHEPVPDALRER